MQNSSSSPSSSSSSGFATDELRVGVADSCLPFFGTGVPLARLVAGVPVRGEALPLSVSILRFFDGGFTAVPFLGAARFLGGPTFGFTGRADESPFWDVGGGEALDMTFLRGVPGVASCWTGVDVLGRSVELSFISTSDDSIISAFTSTVSG